MLSWKTLNINILVIEFPASFNVFTPRLCVRMLRLVTRLLATTKHQNPVTLIGDTCNLRQEPSGAGPGQTRKLAVSAHPCVRRLWARHSLLGQQYTILSLMKLHSWDWRLISNLGSTKPQGKNLDFFVFSFVLVVCWKKPSNLARQGGINQLGDGLECYYVGT